MSHVRFEKNRSPIRVLLLLVTTVLTSTPVLSHATVVAASSFGCGDTITVSTTLNADIGPCSGDGLVVGANNMVLDCAGHTITGTNGFLFVGIRLPDISGVTIKRCNVEDFYFGFLLASSSNNILGENMARGDSLGFVLGGSSSNILKGNAANSNSLGFELDSSSSNALSGNTANNNGNGFELDSSSSNALSGNTANNNFQVGFFLGSSSGNILKGNAANSTALGFLQAFGFVLSKSSSNTLSGNTAGGNGGDGYVLDHSSNNTLRSNTAESNGRNGFFLAGSSNNALKGNIAKSNSFGFFVVGSSIVFGGNIVGSSNNTFSGNTANNDGNGFLLDFFSTGNTLLKNVADSNVQYGYTDFNGVSATTVNTYTRDECDRNGTGGSSPTGLCTPQA